MRQGLLIAVLGVGLGLFGCGPIVLEEEDQPMPVLSLGKDPFTLQSVSVSGDFLEVETSYGGGCEKHSFWVEWDGAFLESLPVQARLVVRHEARNDRCLALIGSDKRRFDLSPLKESYRRGYREQQGSIVLRVQDAPAGSVVYTF